MAACDMRAACDMWHVTCLTACDMPVTLCCVIDACGQDLNVLLNAVMRI